MCLHCETNDLDEWREIFRRKDLELEGAEKMHGTGEQWLVHEIQFFPLEGDPEYHRAHPPASGKAYPETILDRHTSRKETLQAYAGQLFFFFSLAISSALCSLLSPQMALEAHFCCLPSYRCFVFEESCS